MKLQLGTVVRTVKPSSAEAEAEAGGSLGVEASWSSE